MNKDIKKRVLSEANHIIKTQDTIRKTADHFNVSKSTVHKDVSERLLKINPALASEVRIILDENKAERHIRGGLATKYKYNHLKDKEVS